MSDESKSCATCTTPRHEPSDCGNCRMCLNFDNWTPMQQDDYMLKPVDEPETYGPRKFEEDIEPSLREVRRKAGHEPVVSRRVVHPGPNMQTIKKPDGGPSSYYDFDPGWVTFNDFMEDKALKQWGPFSLHLKDVGKAICRWGTKEGTTDAYDARKIVYSGLRLLIMLEGREAVVALLQRLSSDPQFKER